MTSFQLKIIAILAMTIDHTASVLGQMGLFPNLPTAISYPIMELMGSIGRMAFPLFAFMIAEGAQKTGSMPKYIGRLALFAVISEPVFYFSHWRYSPTLLGLLQNILDLNFGNVLFTLALGAAAIYFYQFLERKQGKHGKLWFIPIFLLIVYIAGSINCDYGMAGVFLIVFLFLARTKFQKCIVILFWTVCLYGFGQSYNPLSDILMDCFFAALSCVFVWFYNGKRGKGLKWSFYVYYPAHLLVLTMIHAML